MKIKVENPQAPLFNTAEELLEYVLTGQGSTYQQGGPSFLYFVNATQAKEILASKPESHAPSRCTLLSARLHWSNNGNIYALQRLCGMVMFRVDGGIKAYTSLAIWLPHAEMERVLSHLAQTQLSLLPEPQKP